MFATASAGVKLPPATFGTAAQRGCCVRRAVVAAPRLSCRVQPHAQVLRAASSGATPCSSTNSRGHRWVSRASSGADAVDTSKEAEEPKEEEKEELPPAPTPPRLVPTEDPELMAATVTAGALVIQRPLDAPGWIQKLEKIYSSRLDIIPTILGELNVATGFMIFFTGAVIKAAEDAAQALAQWVFFIVVPAFLVLFLLRRWFFFRGLRFEEQVDGTLKKVAEPGAPIQMRANVLTLPRGTKSDTKKEAEARANTDEVAAPQVEEIPVVAVPGDEKLRRGLFRRRYRSNWVDFHLSLQLLLPGGMNGSYELLCMVPVMMFVRFLSRMSRTGRFASRMVRWWTILFAPLALASMVFMAVQSLGTLFTLGPIYQQAGILGVGLFVPFSLITTYIIWLAPMVLIPGAWLRAWRNRIPKKQLTIEQIEAKKKKIRETPKTSLGERFIWIFAFLGALFMAAGPLQGRWYADLPVTAVFASQMFVGWRKKKHLLKKLAEEDGLAEGKQGDAKDKKGGEEDVKNKKSQEVDAPAKGEEPKKH